MAVEGSGKGKLDAALEETAEESVKRFYPSPTVIQDEVALEKYLAMQGFCRSPSFGLTLMEKEIDYKAAPQEGGVFFAAQVLGLLTTLPLPKLAREILEFFQLAPTQLSPGSWRVILAVNQLVSMQKVPFGLDEFRCAYQLKKAKDNVFCFSPRSTGKLISNLPTSDKNWHKSIVRVSGMWESSIPEECGRIRTCWNSSVLVHEKNWPSEVHKRLQPLIDLEKEEQNWQWLLCPWRPSDPPMLPPDPTKSAAAGTSLSLHPAVLSSGALIFNLADMEPACEETSVSLTPRRRGRGVAGAKPGSTKKVVVLDPEDEEVLSLAVQQGASGVTRAAKKRRMSRDPSPGPVPALATELIVEEVAQTARVSPIPRVIAESAAGPSGGDGTSGGNLVLAGGQSLPIGNVADRLANFGQLSSGDRSVVLRREAKTIAESAAFLFSLSYATPSVSLEENRKLREELAQMKIQRDEALSSTDSLKKKLKKLREEKTSLELTTSADKAKLEKDVVGLKRALEESKSELGEKKLELATFTQSCDDRVEAVREEAKKDVARLRAAYYVIGYKDGGEKAPPKYVADDVRDGDDVESDDEYHSPSPSPARENVPEGEIAASAVPSSAQGKDGEEDPKSGPQEVNAAEGAAGEVSTAGA